MKKAKIKAQPCFTITVDGKKYGPFQDRHREKVKHLEHLKGVEIMPVLIESGWFNFCPPPTAESKER